MASQSSNLLSLTHSELPGKYKRAQWDTFGNEGVLARAGYCAVDFPNDLHIVEERVESIKEREANHVSSASSHDLQTREPI